MKTTTTGLCIEDRIRSMVRADYDAGVLQNTLPERYLPPQVAFFRITELARFWDDPQSGKEPLAERQQALITSLYGIRTPWAYVVLGDGGVSNVFIGLSCDDRGRKSYGQLLTAQLPGSSWRLDRPSKAIVETLSGFPLVSALSGNPSITRSGDQPADLGHPSAGIEVLLETMSGVRWAYLVLARPLTDQEVADDFNRVESELREMNSAYHRRGSAEENNNPVVARYVSLLEAAHRNLLQGQSQGMWDVQSCLLTESQIDCQRGTQALYTALGGPASVPQPFRIKTGSRNGIKGSSTPMITRLNTAELTMMTGLPQREVAGLQVTDYVAFGMSVGEFVEDGIALGKVMSGGTCTSRWYEVSMDSLCKHVFVAGVPGAGKTRTCLYVLSQLWREHKIPWLVLEPSMKSEYRALLRSTIGADVRVLTAGDETVAPLRLNPLEVPDGIHVQTHIGGLATIFKAAFAMEAPLPYVLDEAIHRVYEDRGWNFVTGTHPAPGAEAQPTLGDLLETCNRVVDDLGYESELKGNLKAALRTRLSSLMRGAKGRMLNVRRSVSMKYLLSAPTVIEFSAIGDDDEKAFLLGCILLKLAQHRQTEGLSTSGLRHVTLIEEAHRLLRNVSETAGSSTANPRRQAVETFSNMLAELRAFGEGLIVVDQMPSKLVPDVIRNSGLKIVHRLTAEEERTVVGGAMALNEAQTRFLAGLSSGQAVVYSDGSFNACRVSIPDHAGHEGYLRDNVSSAEVKELMKGRVQQEPVAASTLTSGVVCAEGNISSQCMETCPAGVCMPRSAVAAYACQHIGELEAAFKRAISEGFDSLWRFGNEIADTVWQNVERQEGGAFCAVMTVAGRLGMADGDIRMLRRNMARLWTNRRPGGVT